MANAIRTVPEVLHDSLSAVSGGKLPWADVMRIALYEPESGYYRQGVRRIGRGGDFFTSVSVGNVFGELLATFCVNVWNQLGCPEEFSILEQGAHDGTLARDVLVALREKNANVFARTQYVIIEPDVTLRAAQIATFGELAAEKLVHAEDWTELQETPTFGVLLCNELLDAFPVHRVSREKGAWSELYVKQNVLGEFVFESGALSSATLEAELKFLGEDFAEGYTTELNLDMLPWLENVAKAKFRGAILLADYGHAAREYYIPERSQGTLRRYFQHRSDANVLENLGESDLTAHVNFTRLAEKALELGLEVTEFIEQGRFLTRLATEIFQNGSVPPTAAWTRQFMSLTHPTHLGNSFQILTLGKGLSTELASAAALRETAFRRLGLPQTSSS